MGILKKLFPRKNEQNFDDMENEFNVDLDEPDGIDMLEAMDEPPNKKAGFRLPKIRLPFTGKKNKEEVEFDFSKEEAEPVEEASDDSGKRKKKNPENEMSPKVKFAIMATCGILIGAGYVLKDNIREYFNPSPMSAENTALDKKNKDLKKDTQVAYTNAVQINPFVERENIAAKIGAQSDSIKNGGNAVTVKTLPTVPAITRTPPVAVSPPVMTRTLPAIPAAPQPAVPSGGTLPSVASVPKVQGVVTDDQGNSMAIMNDGTVVSAGETYKDGRIAYIGGDGITFDNGNKIGMATP